MDSIDNNNMDINNNMLNNDNKNDKNNKKVKKKKNRCQFYDIMNKCKCKKKLSLVQSSTNKCKCGKIFCGMHKPPECHYCDFDYTIKDKDMYEKSHGLGGGVFQKVSII